MKRAKIIIPVITMILIMNVLAMGCVTDDCDDEDQWVIIVNGKEYTTDELIVTFTEVNITGSDGNNYTGISLSDLVNDTGLSDQESHNYTIIAADDSSKEFTWDDMQNGILVLDERKSVFTEKEIENWVKDIVKIEVV